MTDSLPHIAVILPVYNRAKTVFDTLRSIAQQLAPPAELILVDDGSTDALDETIDRWRSEYQPMFAVRVLKQANQGAAAARNAGMAAAPNAAFFAFIDSDDQWPDDYLFRTSAALMEDRAAVAASIDMWTINARTGINRRRQLKYLARNPVRWMIEYGAGVGCATLFRADDVRALGGFPPTILTGHDAHLLLRLALRGKWLHCEGEPAIIGEDNAAERGECTHLRQHFPNHKEIWAAVYEEFIERGGGRGVLLKSFCDRELGRRWREAGNQLAVAGRHDQARRCFARSLHYRPRLKTAIRWGRSTALHILHPRPSGSLPARLPA